MNKKVQNQLGYAGIENKTVSTAALLSGKKGRELFFQ
jgi:hypothetical protein